MIIVYFVALSSGNRMADDKIDKQCYFFYFRKLRSKLSELSFDKPPFRALPCQDKSAFP